MSATCFHRLKSQVTFVFHITLPTTVCSSFMLDFINMNLTGVRMEKGRWSKIILITIVRRKGVPSLPSLGMLQVDSYPR